MATIRKWGNSLAVRIPGAMARQLDVKPGTTVEIAVENEAIVVRPRRRPRYGLKDLLKKCKRSQLHGEMDLGPDIGREVVD